MVGRFLSHLKWDVRGRVNAANVAQDGRRPWWAIVKAGGGGLLANTGLNRVRCRIGAKWLGLHGDK